MAIGLRLVCAMLGLMLLGAALLQLPGMLEPGLSLSWLEALFLATSGVCGVGLSIVDPSHVLAPLGWAVIAGLIELGLLGVLFLGALVVEEINARFPAPAPRPRLSPGALAGRVVALALLVQLAGALLLLPLWEPPMPLAERLGLSLFYALSAFGHGGFSPLPENLEPYRHAALAHAVILPLILLGSLGYPALSNLWRAARSRTCDALTPYTRLVLAMTATLYVGGVIALTASSLAPYFYERLQLGTTSNMPLPGPLTARRAGAAVADASFLSLSARGAGLTTMSVEEIAPAGRFALLLLMLVGGAPGGAGGGLFSATLGVALAAGWVSWRRGALSAGAPALTEAVGWAAAIVLFFMTLVATGIFLLSLFEPYPFIKIAFEVVSGASASGLSLGVTGVLTTFSKIVMLGLMVLGRWGPLVMLGGMVGRRGALRAAG